MEDYPSYTSHSIHTASAVHTSGITHRVNRFLLRAKRWIKFGCNLLVERLRGLDFSMVYVGRLQRETAEFHGYSMTDTGDMRRMLQAVPVDPTHAAFLDIGCGKGMSMKCAAESGYRRVSGLDLDQHLLDIARKNMDRLGLNADCIYANAVEFQSYADYDVFYFYNPFGANVFHQVIEKLKESQARRDRDIWVLYYRPVCGQLFLDAGFTLEKELPDKTRNTTTHYYLLPSGEKTWA